MNATKSNIALIEDDEDWAKTWENFIKKHGKNYDLDLNLVAIPRNDDELEELIEKIANGEIKIDIVLLDRNLWTTKNSGESVLYQIQRNNPEIKFVSVSTGQIKGIVTAISKLDSYSLKPQEIINILAEL